MPSAFAGKVALVTGGGSGLGEEIGKALALRGAKVVLSDINLDAAERVAKEIKKAGGTAGAVQQDTAKPQDAERVVGHAGRVAQLGQHITGHLMSHRLIRRAERLHPLVRLAGLRPLGQLRVVAFDPVADL